MPSGPGFGQPDRQRPVNSEFSIHTVLDPLVLIPKHSPCNFLKRRHLFLAIASVLQVLQEDSWVNYAKSKYYNKTPVISRFTVQQRA